MKFGSRKAGDGQATAQIDDNPDSPGRLTKNRTLPQPSHGKPQFGWSGARRMRLSVRTHAQNALFRRMRFSSPAQTSSHLTEKRILQPAPHGKAHSSPAASRKSAFCSRSSIAAGPKNAFCPATSRKTALWPRQLRAPHQKPQFGWSEARRMRLSVRTRAQNALSRDVPRPECAFP